jgi:hypothetical protein
MQRPGLDAAIACRQRRQQRLRALLSSVSHTSGCLVSFTEQTVRSMDASRVAEQRTAAQLRTMYNLRAKVLLLLRGPMEALPLMPGRATLAGRPPTFVRRSDQGRAA